MDTSSSSIQFDGELIGRYDVNGPRYTSYPTAVQFQPAFTSQQYQHAAAASNRHGAPLSIYIHIPFCTSPCFYCGCSRIITRDHAKADTYLKHLFKEIELQSQLFDRTREVKQLHFGGGTPTFLSIDQFHSLMSKLGEH